MIPRYVPLVCRLDAITPEGEELVVDCEKHGEVGRVPAGGDEYGKAEACWQAHAARLGQSDDQESR